MDMDIDFIGYSISETSVKRFVARWLDTYEHHFEAIDFVDLRGGFGKAHLENSDEPFVVDPKAMPISSKGGWFSKQNLPVDIEGDFMRREESKR